ASATASAAANRARLMVLPSARVENQLVPPGGDERITFRCRGQRGRAGFSEERKKSAPLKRIQRRAGSGLHLRSTARPATRGPRPRHWVAGFAPEGAGAAPPSFLGVPPVPTGVNCLTLGSSGFFKRGPRSSLLPHPWTRHTRDSHRIGTLNRRF